MPVIVNGTQLKCSNSPSGPGHHWVVYTATVTGRLQVDPGPVSVPGEYTATVCRTCHDDVLSLVL